VWRIKVHLRHAAQHLNRHVVHTLRCKANHPRAVAPTFYVVTTFARVVGHWCLLSGRSGGGVGGCIHSVWRQVGWSTWITTVVNKLQRKVGDRHLNAEKKQRVLGVGGLKVICNEGPVEVRPLMHLPHLHGVIENVLGVVMTADGDGAGGLTNRQSTVWPCRGFHCT
jgi:hypothetical protein